VVEGYKTTKAAFELAQKYEIRARIFTGMYQILYEGMEPRELMKGLMALPSRFEGE